jgi:hypothetical protein
MVYTNLYDDNVYDNRLSALSQPNFHVGDKVHIPEKHQRSVSFLIGYLPNSDGRTV